MSDDTAKAAAVYAKECARLREERDTLRAQLSEKNDLWKAAMLDVAEAGKELREARRQLSEAQAGLDAHRKALAAVLDFAATVAGDSAWWDDMWPEHEAAIAAPVPAAHGVSNGFYIACFRHSRRGKALWWGPNFAGYTPYLEQAGIYTEPELRERGGFFGEHCQDVPVPVAYARGLAVSLIDTGHATARPFWSAEDLRAALSAQQQKEGK